MSSKDTGIDRRRFLQYSTVAGLSALVSASWPRLAMAATKERLTIPASVSIHFTHTLTVPVPSMASGSTCSSRSSMLITPARILRGARRVVEFQERSGCFI